MVRFRRFLRLLSIVVVAVVTTGLLTSAAGHVIGPEGEDHDADSGQVDEDEDAGGPQAPADYLDDKFTSFRTVTDDQVQRAEAQAAALPENGNGWRLTGPSNVGGRITGLVVDPRRLDTMYVAAAGGGVWRSTDAAATFQPAWPSGLPQAIGSLEMGRDGTLWAGTGEANPSGGGLTFFGKGVYRSTDGGRSWDSWGLTRSGSIAFSRRPGSAAMPRVIRSFAAECTGSRWRMTV